MEANATEPQVPAGLPEPPERTIHEAEVASAFSHPLRLCLLRKLATQPYCVNELVNSAGVSQPMVSRHLATLRKLGLVSCRVEGRKRCYDLEHPDFVNAMLTALGQAPE